MVVTMVCATFLLISFDRHISCRPVPGLYSNFGNKQNALLTLTRLMVEAWLNGKTRPELNIRLKSTIFARKCQLSHSGSLNEFYIFNLFLWFFFFFFFALCNKCLCSVLWLACWNRRFSRQRQRGILHQRSDLRKQEVLSHQGQPPNRWRLDNGHQDEEPRRRANIQCFYRQSWQR